MVKPIKLKIGTQTGKVKNLADPASIDCWAYMITEGDVTKYGSLYVWETANELYPKDKNLPGDAEWNILKQCAGLNSAKENKKEIKSANADIFKTINITTAGSLSTALTATELSTVTNLTVTGTIDARDFVTMSDNMPSLKVLEIKDVNIVAFSGQACPNCYWIDYSANVIPYGAFAHNKIITSITIPSSATSIDYWAFSSFSGSINVDENSLYLSSIDGILFDKAQTKLLRCPISKTGVLTLPSSVNYIGHAAFWGCKDLTTIILPPSLTTIDRYAFMYCSGLTSFHFPASLTFIGDDIFGSSTIERRFYITVDVANKNFSSLDGVLFDKDQTRLILCSALKTGSYTIPSTVKYIDPKAFSYCQSLTEISIPSSVSTIGNYAFSMCSMLTGTLTIPSAVTKIDDFTFFGCDFTSVIIPNTIDSIGTWAFMGISNLTTISIPSSVKYLGPSAFGCDGLTSIYANSTIPINIELSSDVFWSVNKTSCILHVPSGTKSLYSLANEWKDFTNIVVMPATSVNEIDNEILSIYPNPSSTTLFISNIVQKATISIYNLQGKLLINKPVINKQLDIQDLSSGTYILQIVFNNRIITKKLIKL